MCFDITKLTNSFNKGMKTSCIIITIALVLSIILLGIMVKIAADISVEEQSKEIAYFGDIFRSGKHSGSLRVGVENSSFDYIADRYPYLVAIIETNRTRMKPAFSCFGAMISRHWLISSAHCHTPTSKYRVLLLYDFANNFSWTHPVLHWRLHSKYQDFDPEPIYDIALARVNLTEVAFNHLRFASVDRAPSKSYEVSVWKTLNYDDEYQTAYLTNDFSSYNLKATDLKKCDAILLKRAVKQNGGDGGLICVDLNQYSDCFVNEFGPIFIGDKIVGILTKKPEDCKIKYAVFTSVSYHCDWIRIEIKG